MTFLRNCWYVAGFPEDVTRQPIERMFLGEPVVLYRSEAGAPIAMDNRCAHRFASLARGSLVGDAIQCLYHGLRYGPSGECVHMPNGEKAPPRAKLHVYPVVEKHAILWIWMGETAAADPATVPDFAYLEEEGFGWFNGTLHAKANYQLFVDNLLDLSHAEFLHPLLRSDGWARRNESTIKQEGNSLHILNVAKDDNIFALNRALRPDFPDKGTLIQRERLDDAGSIKLIVEFHANDDMMITPSGHFLTPETEVTTHYFVRAGQNIAPHSEEMTAGMREGVLAVFRTEDIPVIEDQQRLMGNRNWMEAEPAILKTDMGAIRARRIVERRIRLENEPAAETNVAAE